MKLHTPAPVRYPANLKFASDLKGSPPPSPQAGEGSRLRRCLRQARPFPREQRGLCRPTRRANSLSACGRFGWGCPTNKDRDGTEEKRAALFHETLYAVAAEFFPSRLSPRIRSQGSPLPPRKASPGVRTDAACSLSRLRGGSGWGRPAKQRRRRWDRRTSRPVSRETLWKPSLKFFRRASPAAEIRCQDPQRCWRQTRRAGPPAPPCADAQSRGFRAGLIGKVRARRHSRHRSGSNPRRGGRHRRLQIIA